MRNQKEIKYKYTTDFFRTVALLLHNKTPNPMHLSSIKEGTQKKTKQSKLWSQNQTSNHKIPVNNVNGRAICQEIATRTIAINTLRKQHHNYKFN